MNNEEAIENLIAMEKEMRNGYGNAIVNVTLEDLCCAISALKNQQKYHWHDLRKDPNDLPKENGRKYIITQCGTKKYHIANWMDGNFGEWNISPLADATITFNEFAQVDRWKEIEPFEVE